MNILGLTCLIMDLLSSCFMGAMGILNIRYQTELHMRLFGIVALALGVIGITAALTSVHEHVAHTPSAGYVTISILALVTSIAGTVFSSKILRKQN